MKLTPLLLTSLAFTPTVLLRAGDAIPLDRSFAFRLTPPGLALPPAVPPLPAHPSGQRATPITPEGVPLPPGSRPLRFDGQTYYFIPL